MTKKSNSKNVIFNIFLNINNNCDIIKKGDENKMKIIKKISSLILMLISFVLELFPNGAVLKFIVHPEIGKSHYVYRYYSYFDLTPFGYASFGPLLTGVITIVILILISINLIKYKLNKPILIFSVIGLITSLMPLMYGIDYFSIVGIFISVCYLLNILLFIKKDNKEV